MPFHNLARDAEYQYLKEKYPYNEIHPDKKTKPIEIKWKGMSVIQFTHDFGDKVVKHTKPMNRIVQKDMNILESLLPQLSRIKTQNEIEFKNKAINWRAKMKRIYVFTMMLIFVYAKNVLAHDLVTEYIFFKNDASANICPKINGDFHYITDLNVSNKDLDGSYYGIMRDNHRSYTIKINFKNNYFDYIDIINNNAITILKSGYHAPHEYLRFLKASCADLYSDKKDCHKDNIFSLKQVNIKDISNLCTTNPVPPSILKTKYIGRLFGNYMLANGFNTDFINRVIIYKEKKQEGQPFCRIKGFGFDDCVPDD